MFRRRFKSSYNNVGDGVYAVNKNLRLIPVSEADNTCIGIALVYDRHRIMIEKNEDSNQSYKDVSAGVDMVRIRRTLQIINIWMGVISEVI